MEGAFGAAVRRGVEIAFERFLALIEDPQAGREQPRAGRSTSTSAGASSTPGAASTRCWPPTASARGWRGGASWRPAARRACPPRCSTTSARRSSPTSTRSRPSPPTATRREQSTAAGETQRRRRRLVRLLAEDPPASEEAIRTAASAAIWPLPRRVAALAMRPEGVPGAGEGATGAEQDVLDTAAVSLARRLGGNAIGAEAWGRACVFVPDPDAPGRRRQLEAALDGERAALGPTVDWRDAGASVQPGRGRARARRPRAARGRRRPPRHAPAGRRPRARRRAGRSPASRRSPS